MTTTRLSIVVPTYSRRGLLERTLPALLNQAGAAGGAEILVVVDGSRDGTLEMLSRFRGDPLLRVVSQENRGLAAARNRGAHAASSEVVLFLDDDMILKEGSICAHREAHTDGMERVVFGGLALAEGLRHSFLKQGIEIWGGQVEQRLSTPGYEFRFDDCHFGHASMSRQLLQRAGGFDESFIRYGNEDYDLGWRLIQAGAEMRYLSIAVARQIYDKTLYRWLRDCECVGMADRDLAGKHPSLERELRFASVPHHPLKRVARASGLSTLDPLAPAWSLLEAGMASLEWMGARGSILGKAQSLLGERRYWKGFRRSGASRAEPQRETGEQRGRTA
ncbi:MAG: glycosyltransferase [Acidobacteria bacterium]|nr:glycosyltransferase [Acidobacteriota bacterium]